MDIPVKVGDIEEGQIIDINHQGGGVTKKNNFTIFLNEGLIGDIVKYKVTKVKKNYAFGRLINIISPSQDRIPSKCRVSQTCGGCQFQSFNYNSQLKWKKEKVKKDLIKIAALNESLVKDTIGMENPYRYRNNVQIPVGLNNGNISIGFYDKRSYNIANTNRCIIQSKIGDKIIKIIREFMHEYNIKPYNKKSKKGTIRHIGIRTNKDNKAMIILVTNSNKIPYSSQLINMIVENCKEVVSIYQNINKNNGSLVYGNKFKKLYGKDKIIDYIGDLKFYISPNSFFQVNREQTKKLYDKVVEYIKLKDDEIVFDLYCGIGTISLYIAKQAKKVYGIEIVQKAIEDAKENAKFNNIDNVEFISGTSEKIFPMLLEKGIKADKIVLDPPRKGCDKKVLDTIVDTKPKAVVYVSCNPSTLARDLVHLCKGGYEVKEIQPVDMFPWTTHVECVVRICRCNP